MQFLQITIENVGYPVLLLPGRPKALLDRTVAQIYGVETKHINQNELNDVREEIKKQNQRLSNLEANLNKKLANIEASLQRMHDCLAHAHLPASPKLLAVDWQTQSDRWILQTGPGFEKIGQGQRPNQKAHRADVGRVQVSFRHRSLRPPARRQISGGFGVVERLAEK